MRRKLLRIGRTAIYIHMATLVFSAYWVCLGQWKLLLLSMLSICLHEAAHACVSALWGMPPEEVELTPLGMLMRLDDDIALSPGKRLAVLTAGPAMSLMLCWCAIFLTKAGMLSADIGRQLFLSNLLFLLLNLLPALPLDGGRILSLLLGLRLKDSTVRRIMRINGNVLGVGLIALNIWLSLRTGGWNLSMSMTGCFLIYAASVSTATAAWSKMKMLMDRKIRFEKQGRMTCQWQAVYAHLPVRLAVEQLLSRRYTMFLLLEPGTLRMLGCLDENTLLNAYWDDPAQPCKTLLSEERPCAD